MASTVNAQFREQLIVIGYFFALYNLQQDAEETDEQYRDRCVDFATTHADHLTTNTEAQA